jgi:hypothetical protein
MYPVQNAEQAPMLNDSFVNARHWFCGADAAS